MRAGAQADKRRANASVHDKEMEIIEKKAKSAKERETEKKKKIETDEKKISYVH